ncbi:hypothetical protein [Rhodothalassium salexigens]|uniref:hypothetical protein n=1 Tax=Rhodothalassium salexigens TaxID=1086 RepID=UPI001913EDBC|nr:hypothetical protein [Rhodothalassium salexigens]
MMNQWNWIDNAGILAAAFAVAFLVSTLVIRLGIPHLKSDNTVPRPGEPTAPLPDSSDRGRVFDWRATGFWIGFCETVLLFVLVFADQFSALAILIGAKEFVRKERIAANPSYYLLGTLVNLTVAVLCALAARALIAGG